MKEFTWRALLLGLVMCVILGAANAYLGLKSGVTIAATYPAAVIGMAVLRIWKGSILEENIARTAGSIGESVAAGAVFTLPAFLISGAWSSFDPSQAYWKSTSMMVVGSIIGVLFVSLVRRVMVEDPTLPFPESMAAAEIHKAGQRGAEAARYLFWNIGVGSLVQLMGAFNLYAVDKDIPVTIGSLGANGVRLGPAGSTNTIPTGGHYDVFRAHRQSCVHGCRLRDRAGARGAPVFRRAARLGRAGSAVHVLPRSTDSGVHSRGCGRSRMGRSGRGRVAIHRSADCGRWNARRRGVHAVPHGQEPDVEPGTRAGGSSARLAAAGIHGANRTLHGIENRALADRRDVSADDRAVCLHLGEHRRGSGCRGGHADRRILLRHGVRKPGGHDRIVQ